MNFKKLAAFVQLSRPVNVLITLVSIPVACWIAGAGDSHWLVVLLAGLTGALVAAGANAINDVFDIEIDRINRPNRPLPRGSLRSAEARRMWLLVSLAAIGINIFLNMAAFLIVVLSVAILYVYSSKLKRTVLLGNLVIGLMTGLAFIYGGAVIGRVERAVVPAVFAFLVNLTRELLKDVEDVKGDRQDQAVTLPVKYGVTPSLVLASITVLVLIGTTIAVAGLAVYHPAFLYIVLVADGLMGASMIIVWRDHSIKVLRVASTILKVSMIIGLVSIIAGTM